VGKGAYGSVCQAVDVNSGKEVAIKRIANVFVSKTDALRILREVTRADCKFCLENARNVERLQVSLHAHVAPMTCPIIDPLVCTDERWVTLEG
jgi:serine/threonine protein kinase